MKSLHRFGYVMLGELATTRHFYATHREIYRLSGGRLFSRSLGCPVVLLTTTGRKSGEPRTAPIFGFEEGQSVVVVPSNAGKKHYPAWYFNLRANPLAKVQLGSEIRTVRAREATSEERERLWPRLVTYYGGYQVYLLDVLGQTPISPGNFDRDQVKPTLKRAGVTWHGFHAFRRGLATNLHALEVQDIDIQQILRHASVDVTREGYIKGVNATAKTNLEKINTAWLQLPSTGAN